MLQPLGAPGGHTPVDRRPTLDVLSRTLIFYINAGHPVQWSHGEHVFLFNVRLTRALTTGDGACAGCNSGAEIEFTELELRLNGVFYSDVTTVAHGNAVTWNGGLVPARSTSWAQVKAVYR